MDTDAAADLLHAGLLHGAPDPAPRIADLPPACRPASEAEAYAIQAALIARLGGAIGGWKVGAPGPDAPISCAPLPSRDLVDSPASLPAERFTLRGVESEIAFRLGADLPPRRERAYAPAEILDAIASSHPVIEVLQSRFADPDAATPLSNLADLIQHGALIIGTPIADWRAVDYAAMTIHQTATGTPDRERTGNPAGDMIRLIAWLADRGAVWAGGLKAGQIVTCGSWTGKSFPPGGGRAVAKFSGADPVIVEFG